MDFLPVFIDVNNIGMGALGRPSVFTLTLKTLNITIDLSSVKPLKRDESVV
jgi:hypothetical protein